MRETRTRLLITALLFVLLAAATAVTAAPPPILDRELFFGDPEIAGAQISPDGKFIAFMKPFEGTRNLWVKKTDEPFESARPLTDDTRRPIPAYFWTRDSRFILFVQDQAGDENYNVYAVDPKAEPAEGRKVPAARNLTDAKGVQARIYDVPKKDPDLIRVGLNDRDAAWHDLYEVKISTGERKLLRTNTDRIAAWIFDRQGRLRLGLRVADNGDTEILRVDESGFTPLYTCSVFESCGPQAFHKDGRRVYLETNKGDGVDLTRLVLFDVETKKEELVESDPKSRVDFGGAIFSDRTDQLIGTVYVDDRTRVYWKDKDFEADYQFLQKKLPGKEISLGSMTADEKLALIAAGSDTEPGERWLFDRATKKLILQYRVFEKLPREHLATMEPIRYPSSDGVEIPAYLTLPRGVPAKGLPLIVFPHGGPWARDTWGYDPFAQILANRGYAVLQPNFRGSTGYGKKFLNLGNNEWGQKMQDDLTWGVKHLVSKGIADPKKVGIMGASYGGYATLAGVTFTPDVYAAGVSLVGPSNLITLLDSIPPYWEAIRKIFHVRMGDPSTPEGKAQLERQSPLNSAGKIKTPLMVVQGANDPRVKKAESDQIVVALRDRGFPVEYLVAPDEGHGFARPINNLAMFAASEAFLAKHLGGRFQEDRTAEIAKRLSEITVDPKTVTLARAIDAGSVGVPVPATMLVPGSSSYQSKLEAGGQSLSMSVSREIKEEDGKWVITDSVESPMGKGGERTELDKTTLVVLSRAVTQGPVSIDLKMNDKKATGSFNVGGSPRDVAIDLGGELFGDGAGADQVLATLPLAEGYTTNFRTLDLQRQKVRLMKLEVSGSESVTVPAGTFDTFKMEITSAEGDPDSKTVWVAKEGGKVVKSAATLPQMGGAVVTTELLP